MMDDAAKLFASMDVDNTNTTKRNSSKTIDAAHTGSMELEGNGIISEQLQQIRQPDLDMSFNTMNNTSTITTMHNEQPGEEQPHNTVSEPIATEPMESYIEGTETNPFHNTSKTPKNTTTNNTGQRIYACKIPEHFSFGGRGRGRGRGRGAKAPSSSNSERGEGKQSRGRGTSRGRGGKKKKKNKNMQTGQLHQQEQQQQGQDYHHQVPQEDITDGM